MEEENLLPIQNSQAPANQAKKDNVTSSTPDYQMGYGLPDEQQRMADMISQMSGFDPLQQVPTGAAQVLPPSYYNPTQNQSVILGSSGGLAGNSPLMSAGIPMFSPSVLQQADEQLKEAKKLQYVSQMKDFEDLSNSIAPVLVSDNVKQEKWLDIQNREWGNTISGLQEKFGVNAYKKGKTTIARKAAEIKMAQQSLDDTFKQATNIIALYEGARAMDAEGKGAGTFYVSKSVYNKAKAYMEWAMDEDWTNTPLAEINKRNAEYGIEFRKATSLADATKPAIDGLDKLVSTGDVVGTLKEWGKNSWNYVKEYTGVAALEDVTTKQLYDSYLQNYYDNAYGGLKANQRPTKKEFDDYVYGAAKNQVKFIDKSMSAAPVTNINMPGEDKRRQVTATPETIIQIGDVKVAVQNSTSFSPNTVPYQSIRGMVRNMDGEIVKVAPKDTQLNTIVMYDNKPFVIGTATVQKKDSKGKMVDVSETIFMPLTGTVYDTLKDYNNFNYNYTPINSKEEIEIINKYIDDNKNKLKDIFGAMSQKVIDEGNRPRIPGSQPQNNRAQFKNNATGELEWFVKNSSGQWVKE